MPACHWARPSPVHVLMQVGCHFFSSLSLQSFQYYVNSCEISELKIRFSNFKEGIATKKWASGRWLLRNLESHPPTQLSSSTFNLHIPWITSYFIFLIILFVPNSDRPFERYLNSRVATGHVDWQARTPAQSHRKSLKHTIHFSLLFILSLFYLYFCYPLRRSVAVPPFLKGSTSPWTKQVQGVLPPLEKGEFAEQPPLKRSHNNSTSNATIWLSSHQFNPLLERQKAKHFTLQGIACEDQPRTIRLPLSTSSER